MECGTYSGIELLEHAMQRIFEDRNRQQVTDIQFGFMKGKGTSVAIFTRDSIYAIARISHGNSVRLSVCLSVRHTGGSVKNG